MKEAGLFYHNPVVKHLNPFIYRHEVINIDLKNKPDWFLEKNPLGKVPTLEQDQRIVFDSLICCDYLDEVYPENRLTPSDPYRQAQDKMLLEMFSQVESTLTVFNAEILYTHRFLINSRQFWLVV